MDFYTATKGIIFLNIPAFDEIEEEDMAKVDLLNGELKYVSVINKVLLKHGVGANKMVKVVKHADVGTFDISSHVSEDMSLYDFETQFGIARKKNLKTQRLKRLIALGAPEHLINNAKEELLHLEISEPDFRDCFYFAQIKNQPVKLFVRDTKFILYSVFLNVDDEFLAYNDLFEGEEDEQLDYALLIDSILEESKLELRLEDKALYFEAQIPDNMPIAVNESLVSFQNKIPRCQIFFKNKEVFKNIPMERFFEDAKAQHSKSLLGYVADILNGDEVRQWMEEYRDIVRKNMREQLPGIEMFL